MHERIGIERERDYNLDIYRGCVMLYIVGFVHIISIFSNWYANDLLTLSLIEIPAIFYIAGASYSLSRPKPYGEYLWGRIKRIFIPLIIYLLFIAAVMSIKQGVPYGDTIVSIFHTDYHTFVSGEIFNQPHLWFIAVYFSIAIILPLLYRISNYLTGYRIYLLIVVLMTVLYIYPNHIACYLIPVFLGFFYHRKKPYNRYIILGMMIMAMVLSLYIGYGWNMQINKFPANIMFLSYTSTALIILARPLQWVCRQLGNIPITRKVILHYAHHGFSIYLYHIPIISGLNFLYDSLGNRLPILYNHCIAYPAMALMTIACMMVIGSVADGINNGVIRCLEYSCRIWDKKKAHA